MVAHQIGDAGEKHGCSDGGVEKALAHGLASGTISSLSGGDFGRGVAAGAAAEVASGMISPESEYGK